LTHSPAPLEAVTSHKAFDKHSCGRVVTLNIGPFFSNEDVTFGARMPLWRHDKLASGEEEDSIGVSLKGWCIVKLE